MISLEISESDYRYSTDVLLLLLAMASQPGPDGSRPLSPAEQDKLRRLFLEHSPVVWRVLRRSGLNEAKADDGVQQVFIVAMRRLGEIVEGSERSFLCSCAVWVARRMRTNAAKEELIAEIPEAASDEQLDEIAERRRQRKQLDVMFSKLDDELREVLLLQELGGLSRSETANALGLPEGTVASRSRRAREAFHRLVREYFEKRSP